MERLTKEVIQKIKDKKLAGVTLKKISEELKVPITTIYYHYNQSYREHKKAYERDRGRLRIVTKEQRERRNDYSKKYFKERYKTDPEFREKHIARVMRRQKELYKKKGEKK